MTTTTTTLPPKTVIFSTITNQNSPTQQNANPPSNSWLSPAIRQNSISQYEIDDGKIIDRVEKVLFFFLPVIWATTYAAFNSSYNRESSFCLSVMCCVPIPDTYYFIELFRANRCAKQMNQPKPILKTN